MPKAPSSEFSYIEELGILRQALNKWSFSLGITIVVNIFLLVILVAMFFREPSRIFVVGPDHAGLAYPKWPEGRFEFTKSKLEELSNEVFEGINK